MYDGCYIDNQSGVTDEWSPQVIGPTADQELAGAMAFEEILHQLPEVKSLEVSIVVRIRCSADPEYRSRSVGLRCPT